MRYEYSMDIITFYDLGKQGRLGNQLFQIATTVATALRNNIVYAFPKWEYNKQLRTPIQSFVNDYEEKIKLSFDNIYREETFNYNEIDLSNLIKKDNTVNVISLSGYFQSEKYFKDYRPSIIRLFAPSSELHKEVINKYYSISSQTYFAPTCSIHVRRTDYVDNQFYHPLDMEYYTDSIIKMIVDEQVANYIVFSDDIDWCKEHFAPLIHLFKDISIKFSEGNDELTDLMLMKYCHHHIIANSSFSWWGAWLCINPEKKVIFPPKWFGPACNHDSKDLIF